MRAGLDRHPIRGFTQAIKEARLFDRFDQARVDPEFMQFPGFQRLSVRGQNNQAYRADDRVAPDRTDECKAIHFRHLKIDQRIVVRLPCDRRISHHSERFFAPGRAIWLHLPGQKLVAQDLEIGGVIVDHEYAQVANLLNLPAILQEPVVFRTWP